MSTRMSKQEREQFLSGVHVGVVSLPRADSQQNALLAPLTVPVWYDFSPSAGLWFVTDADSRKGALLRKDGPLSLCAQTESPPYQYVSVEGLVANITPADREQHLRPMAQRYLGRAQGDAYANASQGSGSILVRVKIQRWLTVDYGKR